MKLEYFDVDSATGFLPNPDPLTCLPAEFAAWDALGAQLPALLLAGQARHALASMPALDTAHLSTKYELERAMLLLSTFVNAYVWGEADVETHIPAALAVPLWEVTQRVGRKPIISHASNVLYNWRRIDPAGPIDLDNMTTLQPFLGSSDEAWFVLVTVAVEARGAVVLPHLVLAQHAVSAGDASRLSTALTHIADGIACMTKTILRMYEKCDPHVFFHRVRPFLAAWPAPGVIYEGVSVTPMMFAGGSAGQSSLVQALDAVLRVRHTHTTSSSFLTEMRDYMPPAHRAFVVQLERGPDVRAFVLANAESHPELMDIYNRCIDALTDFRRKHMEIAVRYITQQAPKAEQALGTGGTSLAKFLGTTRDETRQSKLA
jgi:indoleamine 2,3-dioxygenase